MMEPSWGLENEGAEEGSELTDSFDDSRTTSLPRPRSSLGMSFHQSPSFSSAVPPMVTPSSTRSSFSTVYHAEDDQAFMPPHRPMVGGGAAAAFEALRHDFYLRKHEKQLQAQRQGHSLAQHGDMPMSSYREIPRPSNSQNPVPSSGENPFLHPDQYEMLRQHHHNLIHEMQETSTILNLFEHNNVQEPSIQQNGHAPVDVLPGPIHGVRFASGGRSNSAGARKRPSTDRLIPATPKRHKSMDD